MSKTPAKEMTPEQIAALPYRPNVGVMMINAAGAVWVGQRMDRHKEAWQMPQGGIDKGEDARIAALREALRTQVEALAMELDEADR